MPRGRARQIGWPSRAPSGMTSSWVPVIPNMTLVFSRLKSRPFPYPASSRARRAATSPNSCEVSVASREDGGIPNSVGSNETGERYPPRVQ